MTNAKIRLFCSLGLNLHIWFENGFVVNRWAANVSPESLRSPHLPLIMGAGEGKIYIRHAKGNISRVLTEGNRREFLGGPLFPFFVLYPVRRDSHIKMTEVLIVYLGVKLVDWYLQAKI